MSFTAALSLATALLFSLAPAFRTAKVDPGPTLKETSRVVRGRPRNRLGRALVAGQVALSVILLSGAALFARNLDYLVSLDPGFRPENLLVVRAEPLSAGYRGQRLTAVYGQILERIRSVRGVSSAGLCYYPPVSNEMGSWTQSIAVDGMPRPEEQTYTYFNAVSPGYFETVGTPFLHGRDFGPQDNPSAVRTVIINESLARAFFPGENPLGRRISIGRGERRQNLEIVGVDKDAKYQRLQEPARRIAYLPSLQQVDMSAFLDLMVVARASSRPADVVESIRAELRALDAAVLVRFEMLSDRIRESLMLERMMAALSAFLGGFAVLLASMGLYGLMAYSVARRTNEIGIRMALGAEQRGVLWMVLRETLLLAFVGVIFGFGASLALGRFVASMLHGIRATDPVSIATACLLTLAIASLAGYLPARRASRMDPVVALREE